jgi:hypothetical protein
MSYIAPPYDASQSDAFSIPSTSVARAGGGWVRSQKFSFDSLGSPDSLDSPGIPNNSGRPGRPSSPGIPAAPATLAALVPLVAASSAPIVLAILLPLTNLCHSISCDRPWPIAQLSPPLEPKTVEATSSYSLFIEYSIILIITTIIAFTTTTRLLYCNVMSCYVLRVLSVVLSIVSTTISPHLSTQVLSIKAVLSGTKSCPIEVLSRVKLPAAAHRVVYGMGSIRTGHHCGDDLVG